MNKFRYFRMRAGLRQVDVAKALNVSQPTVAGWEMGRAHPTVSKLPALANLYGCLIEDLLKEE